MYTFVFNLSDLDSIKKIFSKAQGCGFGSITLGNSVIVVERIPHTDNFLMSVGTIQCLGFR